MVQQDILYVRPATLDDLSITRSIVNVINAAFKGRSGLQEKGSREIDVKKNLETKTWTKSEGEIVDGERTTPEEVEAYIHESDARPFLLAFDRSVQPERVIGTLQIQPNNDEDAKLGLISVDPGYQSRGVGNRLVRFAFQYSRELGFDTCRIHVFETRTEILAWYKKLGFVDTGDRVPFHSPHKLKAEVPFAVLTKQLIDELP